MRAVSANYKDFVDAKTSEALLRCQGAGKALQHIMRCLDEQIDLSRESAERLKSEDQMARESLERQRRFRSQAESGRIPGAVL
jgi:hypothetical protein